MTVELLEHSAVSLSYLSLSDSLLSLQSLLFTSHGCIYSPILGCGSLYNMQCYSWLTNSSCCILWYIHITWPRSSTVERHVVLIPLGTSLPLYRTHPYSSYGGMVGLHTRALVSIIVAKAARIKYRRKAYSVGSRSFGNVDLLFRNVYSLSTHLVDRYLIIWCSSNPQFRQIFQHFAWIITRSTSSFWTHCE